MDERLFSLYYKRKENIQFEENDEGLIILKIENNHWIQKLFRKLHVVIPKYSYKELDIYGSFIFKQLECPKSVYQLGQNFKALYPEMEDQLYQRLMLFLNHMTENEKVLERLEHYKKESD